MRLRSSKEVNRAPKPATLVLTKSLTRLLVSGIRDRQNLKPILQNIYILFCSYLSYGVGEGNYRTSVTKSGLKLKLEDSTTLSSILLTEVHNKLSLTSNDASLDQNVGLFLSDCNITDSPEEMLLFWRCCCLVVLLHPLDQTVTQKFQDVVALLRRLYTHLIYSQSEKSTDSSAHLVKRMLEVYVDEVLAERPFQECQAIPDSVSSTWQNQSICYMQMKSVLEVTAAHFLLSVPIDYTLQTFLERLIWTETRVQSHPEVSLTVGLSLIKHPLVMSAPVIFYSHLISLVSEIIGNNSFQQKAGMNTSRSKLSEFYDAAILYNRHFAKVMTNSCSQLDTPLKTTHSAFQSLFQLKIFDKVNWVLVEMNHAWRAQICGTAAIVIADVMSYMKMNIHIICEAHRDDVFTFMSSLISKVNSAEINELLLEKIKALTLQDICLLASILKLMSCSLMQATRCSIIGLSGLEFSSESKLTFLDNSPLSGIMNCLAQYNLLPTKVQQFIIESLKPDLSTHDEYWLMFAHFAGLLPLCMISGLDILVKGCLIFMLVLMNTLTRKEGFSGFSRPFESKSNAHAIPEAISSTTVTESPHNNTPCKTQMKTSSIRAASRFLRARHLTLTLRHQASLDRADISDEDYCNGEAYMKCFTEDADDIAELADYIGCKQGKDYTSWLVNRGKYRHKRLQKFAKQRRRKMTKVCRSLGYTGRVKL